MCVSPKIVPPCARFLGTHIRACLHSPCPEDGGDEVDDGGEAFVGLLVARGNASKGLYAAEEVFDEMPPLVFFPVVLGISAGALAEGAGRSGHDVAPAKVDAGGGEGTVRLLGGCGSRDGDARLEFALVG